MSSLADGQARFIACLQQGPEHFPDDLFLQDTERALLGFKAHANNISHARLVALEDSFPRLRAHLGHEIFHALSRDYIDQAHVMACDINHIATDFPAFLAVRGHGSTEIDLARIEWAWIESYRAAEATPVALTDIATLAEDQLLVFPIAPHPATRLIAITGPMSPELGELVDAQAEALMITRPEALVLFHPLDAVEQAIAKKITECRAMGNLLDHALELGEEATAMQPIIKLIQAGALMRVQE